MKQTTAAAEVAAGPGSLPGRVAGILLAPRETFTHVVAAPRWLGMMALVTVGAALAVGSLLSTDVGQQAWLDQQESQAAAWGRDMTDQQHASLLKVMPYAGYMAGGSILVMAPIITFALAGLLFAVFNAALGGEASYKQVLAVVAHAGAVTLVQQLFVSPLNYFRESLSSPTNLAVFLPMLPEGTFVARLLGMVDGFIVWWTIVLAIGMSVLYRRRTKPVGLAFLAVYAVIALGIALVMSRVGGS